MLTKSLRILTSPTFNLWVYREEIWNVLRNMAKKKCSGPDGFTVEFFIAAWSIIKEDVLRAVLYFSTSLHLPRIVNLAIALVPKQANPIKMSHFRSISLLYCNLQMYF